MHTVVIFIVVLLLTVNIEALDAASTVGYTRRSAEQIRADIAADPDHPMNLENLGKGTINYAELFAEKTTRPRKTEKELLAEIAANPDHPLNKDNILKEPPIDLEKKLTPKDTTKKE